MHTLLLAVSTFLANPARAQLPFSSPFAPSAAQTTDDRTPPPIIRTDKPAPQRIAIKSGAAPAASIALDSLLNRLWRTALTVQLGGRTFYVSGQESHEGNYHVVLTDQATGRPFFFRVIDLIMGSVKITVEGHSYEIGVALKNPLDVYGNPLQISEGSRVVASFPIRDLMRAMYDAGEPVTVGGKSFRLHLTDQLFEGSSGAVNRHGDPLFVLMIEQASGSYSGEKNHFRGDGVKASDVPSDALLHCPFRIPPYDLFYLDLKLSDDKKTLEIYNP